MIVNRHNMNVFFFGGEVRSGWDVGSRHWNTWGISLSNSNPRKNIFSGKTFFHRIWWHDVFSSNMYMSSKNYSLFWQFILIYWISTCRFWFFIFLLQYLMRCPMYIIHSEVKDASFLYDFRHFVMLKNIKIVSFSIWCEE